MFKRRIFVGGSIVVFLILQIQFKNLIFLSVLWNNRTYVIKISNLNIYK